MGPKKYDLSELDKISRELEKLSLSEREQYFLKKSNAERDKFIPGGY
jgi:hypothetical protein